jgi:8-oxo-dGTP pyrophosphatase MutT (NUDIX family)
MSNISDEKNVKVIMRAAAGVIMKEGESGEKLVLLIQRAADDHWPLHYEFPRGKCDKPIGEPIIKCLKREVKEETGLDITPIEFIDEFEYLADGGTRKTICYNYLCKIDNPDQKVKLSKEHDDYKWIGEVGEAELLVMPEQKDTIEKILNPERAITVEPENPFTKNNQIEEYLQWLSQEKT